MHTYLFFPLLISLLFSGCSSVKDNPNLKAKIFIPGVINLESYDSFLVTKVEGNLGSKVTNILVKGLVDSGKFSLLESKSKKKTFVIDAIVNGKYKVGSRLRRRSCSGKELAKSNKMKNFITDYSGHNIKHRAKDCFDKVYRGNYKTSGKIIFTDNISGKLIKEHVINLSYKSKVYKHPSMINNELGEDMVISDISNKMLDMTIPFNKVYRLEFDDVYTSSKVKKGISYVKSGNLNQAEIFFLEALRDLKNKRNRNNLSKINWNLGLIKLALKDFKAAEDYLNKAYNIEDKPKYYAMLSDIKVLNRVISNLESLKKDSYKQSEKIDGNIKGGTYYPSAIIKPSVQVDLDNELEQQDRSSIKEEKKSTEKKYKSSNDMSSLYRLYK